MMSSLLTARQWLIAVIVSVLCIAGYVYLSSHAFVKIKVNTGDQTHFRLYWKTSEDAQYTDANSSLIQIYSGKYYYTAAMGDLRDVRYLRIDPSNGLGLFEISEISIYQSGFEPVRFFGSKLKLLTPLKGISNRAFRESGMIYKPNLPDSQFEAAFKLIPKTDTVWTHIWRVGLLILFALLLTRAYPTVTHGLKYVPALMLMIAALITTMAVISRPHAHPDEHAHLQAAQYYDDHSLPPAACAKGTESTYTNYGTSRLNTNELAYFISGKFLKLLEPVPLDYYLKLRLFNVGLFGLLLLLAFTKPQSRIVLAPLLISPQFWYVFSYFNSDALAIFTALLIAYQLTATDTLFKRLAKGSARNPVLSFIALATLACFLLLTKKNFYFFGLFVLGAGMVATWVKLRAQSNNYSIKPAIGMLIIAALAFGSWSFYQESIHNFERASKVLDCRAQTAEPAYQPGAPLAELNWSLSLDKRGVSIPEMIEKGWAKNVFRSGFGNFGYVAHPASKQHFQLVALLLLLMMGYLYYATLRKGNAFQKWLIAGFTVLCGLLVAVTLYKSWTVDYQPQGRYYFALIPILGALLGWLRNLLNKEVLSFFVISLAALGYYVFISIALLEIAKV